jgi:hypothetical protein
VSQGSARLSARHDAILSLFSLHPKIRFAMLYGMIIAEFKNFILKIASYIHGNALYLSGNLVIFR